MPVIASASSATYDGVFVVQETPPAAPAVGTGQQIGIVGTYNWGPVGKPILTSSPNAQYKIFGTTGPGLNGIIESVPQFANGSTQLWNLRVTDGTDTHPTANVQDTATPSTVAAVARGAYTGTYGNGIQVTTTAGLLAGTNNYTVKLGSKVETYPNATMNKTPTSGAVNLVVASANAQLVRFQYPTLAAPAAVPTDTTQTTGGTLPNAMLYGVMTWITPDGETDPGAEFTVDLTGSTTQTNDVTITPPTAPSYATGYKVYLSETTGTETYAATSNSPTGNITITALPLTGAATTPTTNTATYSVTDAVANGTVTLSGGADGVAGITANDYYGTVAADGSRTGLLALAALGANNGRLSGAFLAGQSDATVLSEAFTWGDGHNVFVHGSIPKGTVTADLATITNGSTIIDNQFGAYDYVWQQVTDPFSGQNVWVSPAAFGAALQGARNPWNSIANVPIKGSQGSEFDLVPEDDYTTVQSARVNAIGTIDAGGAGFTTQLNLSLNNAENLITDTLTQVYIAYGEVTVLGWATERRMSTQFFNHIKQSISTFLDPLVSLEVIGDALGQQQPYLIVCDATNNDDTNLSQGIVNISQTILLVPHARKLIISSHVGRTGTTVTVSTAA